MTLGTGSAAASSLGARIDRRVGCSTISLRRLPLEEALRQIARAGFAEIDLGALPGVCDHVPVPLPPERIEPIAAQVAASGLRVRTVNADIGALDDPALKRGGIGTRLQPLARLAQLTGAPSITLPCGAHGTEPRDDEEQAVRAVATSLTTAAGLLARHGLALYAEAPHSMRLCHDLPRALRLMGELGAADVQFVLDASHVVASGGDCVEAARAFGDRLAHVHLRDAVRGDIHRSIGRGDVDFAALIRHLTATGYAGHYSLELETNDVRDEDRPAAAAQAGVAISALLADAEAAPSRH